MFSEVSASPAISGNTLTLDLSTASLFNVTLNSNITTLTISNPQTTGNTSSFVLVFNYTGTSYAVTWGTAVRWPGNAPPTLTNTNGKRDVFTFFTYDAGTNWQAFISGLNL